MFVTKIEISQNIIKYSEAKLGSTVLQSLPPPHLHSSHLSLLILSLPPLSLTPSPFYLSPFSHLSLSPFSHPYLFPPTSLLHTALTSAPSQLSPSHLYSLYLSPIHIYHSTPSFSQEWSYIIQTRISYRPQTSLLT